MNQDAVFERRRRAGAPRRAVASEAQGIAALFARAFAQDPVVEWLLRRDVKRDAARVLLFSTLLTRFGLPGDEVWTAGEDCAAALWIPPDHVGLKLSWWRELTLIPVIARVTGASGMGRMDAFRKAAERRHPKNSPHWYLMTIGVDPAWQGHGLGSALLDATLMPLDRLRMPAYLESSNEKNLPLYRRHGFEVRDEFRPAADAPPLWGMWREPRAR